MFKYVIYLMIGVGFASGMTTYNEKHNIVRDKNEYAMAVILWPIGLGGYLGYNTREKYNEHKQDN